MKKRTIKKEAKKAAGRRTTITNACGTHLIPRRTDGTIKSEVAVGKSLAADRRRNAATKVKKGQGDKGDAGSRLPVR